MGKPAEQLYKGVQQTLRAEMQKTLGPLLKRWRYTKSSDFAEVALNPATLRFLTRFGTLDAGWPDEERAKRHRELLIELSRASGDALGVAAAWLDLFAGGEYGALADGICGDEPRCGVCALKDGCRYLVAGGREERVSGTSLAERLRHGSLDDLTGSDLLAFLIQGETCGAADFARAEAALKSGAGIRGVFNASPETLTALGYTPAELPRIRALAKFCTLWADERIVRGKMFSKGRDFYDYFHLRLRDLKKEVFFVAFLDQKNALIGEEQVSEGSLTETLVHPREVFASAIQRRAAAVAVVHNHPSGDPTPSSNDKIITKRLAGAAELLQIRLLDHVIVGDGVYKSFVEMGLMP